ncbi:hypothetical protein JQC79_10395 [Ochrobactrum anthropi]|uniref:DUF1382 family protein n=1 Tax=Brucella anthropi TaxID=529 RepID=UPI00194EC81D|nr:hypothetical protein [Brucella anthropi]MBM6396158.1 hypothetical protein [Brucella anthropi]
MTSKVAQIREAVSIAQDMAKAHILFVAIPVLNVADHTRLKLAQAARIAQMDQEPDHAE